MDDLNATPVRPPILRSILIGIFALGCMVLVLWFGLEIVSHRR